MKNYIGVYIQGCPNCSLVTKRAYIHSFSLTMKDDVLSYKLTLKMAQLSPPPKKNHNKAYSILIKSMVLCWAIFLAILDCRMDTHRKGSAPEEGVTGVTRNK